MLLVDLRKAYDSIPRAALRLVLERVGIPPLMLRLIRSLHEGMEARVRVSGSLTDAIHVTNGPRQGCTLAPTLFTLYFAAVVASWRSQSSAPGVIIQYRMGRKLVGDRTAKSRLQSATLTESQFADDAALYTTSHHHLTALANEFVGCASSWGLTVSISKRKALCVNCPDAPLTVPLVDGGTIDCVPQFTYLGGIVNCDGALDREVVQRIAKASRIFGCLRIPIFQCRRLSLRIKILVYRAVVLTTLFYGAETWPVKATHLRQLDVFHRQCVRTLLGVSREEQFLQRLSSRDLAQRTGLPVDVNTLLRQHRLRWLGQVARMDHSRAPKQMLFGELPVARPRHGQRKRWRDVVSSDLAVIGATDPGWYDTARNRPE